MLNSYENIKLIVFDIDGVFTDGSILISEDGTEFKRILFKDIDAFFRLKRDGYVTAFVTGEDTKIARWFKKRFGPDYFFCGCKNKEVAIRKIVRTAHISLKNVCYIGDSYHDLGALSIVGLSACPKDASSEVRKECDLILKVCGGNGAVAALSAYLLSKN